MICPVCEHQQEFGVECEVCGKDLGGLDDLGAPPAAPQVVEGLEATIGERVGEIALDAVADLEVTTCTPSDWHPGPKWLLLTVTPMVLAMLSPRIESLPS